MKSPIDTVKGRIVGYDERTGDVLIRARYEDYFTFCKREYKSCLMQLVDSRPLSGKQRKTCYALLREISNYTGMGADSTKEWMKLKFIVEDLNETADKIFSLSNAPMSLVCGFQRFLVRFILDWDIPCSFPLLNFVDDVQDYIYAWLPFTSGRPSGGTSSPEVPAKLWRGSSTRCRPGRWRTSASHSSCWSWLSVSSTAPAKSSTGICRQR